MTDFLDRRQLLSGVAIAGSGMAMLSWMPAWAQPVSAGIVKPLPMVSGTDITLTIDRMMLGVDGEQTHAMGVNGTVPGPLIRLREGQTVRLNVTNNLADDSSSIHWHGMLVPFQMDGVPGISFPGISPKSTFHYEFPVIQSGTYWYHSHSGLQEQLGHYGPIVVDPAGTDPNAADREHVIVLSDHSAMSPHMIMKKLKQMSGYFNHQKQTLAGALAGKDQSLDQRVMWGGMRMDPTDISDVTGSTYTYLVNGYGPQDNWTALFAPGERVRLRIVNASSMTFFDVRIPGMKMTVVQADGQNVRPVPVDEFQIGVAETYDVIVEPTEAKPFNFIAEAVDRSGMGRATLSPRAGMALPLPPLRARPLATMRDMGMGGGSMQGMDHSGMSDGNSMAGMGGGDRPNMDNGEMAGMNMGGGMQMSMRDQKNAPDVPLNPGVQMLLAHQADRTDEAGQGLADAGHKVLVYTDLVALERNPDTRAPSRAMQIHLTGNMERYMWSFDGKKLSEVKDPIPFRKGERVRVTLVNDTMMAHPIHLHGHFFELVTDKGEFAPRKHTVIVAPGGKATVDLTADAPGDWAFHCHLLYHMHAGMMQVVSVRPFGEEAA